MKPSVNKSLQQLRYRVTENHAYQKLLEENRPVSLELLMKRKQIEEELAAMLKETGSAFSLQDVKDAILHEEDNDDITKVIAMFDRGGDASE